MKVSFTEDFVLQLKEQIKYIAKDKPIAAKKFKKDLLQNIKKDLVSPFQFKKNPFTSKMESIEIMYLMVILNYKN